MSGIKLAVIGCGKWGMNHVRTAYNLFGNGLKYCADSDADLKEKINRISSEIKFHI
ncbi:MAG: hypothetical protein R3A12_04150 [Ignavibacteria bacterium]